MKPALSFAGSATVAPIGEREMCPREMRRRADGRFAWRIWAGWMALVLAAQLVLVGGLLQAQNRSTVRPYRTDPQLQAAWRSAASAAAKSTVQILVNDEQVALGTVVSADGYILTKASEVQGPATVKLPDGRELEARVIGRDDAYDLLLLRVPVRGLPPVNWANSQTAAVGSWVIAPRPNGEVATVGVVSVATRQVPARGPGSYPNPNVGYMGVTLAPSEDGPVVTEVAEGSPAQKAGLRRGDVIYSLAGQRVRNPDQLLDVLREFAPGQTVRLVLLRDQEFVEKEVTLGKRPMDFSRAEFQNRLGNQLSEKRSGFPIVLQHDGVIRPQDCGGPLVNLDGQVIGINIARAGRSESYAIPAEVIQKLLPQLIQGKGVSR
jgi:serine protease Do